MVSFHARRVFCRCLFAFGMLLAVGGVVSACNVPVFRYALEHWRADSFRLTVFHRGPLSETLQALLEPFEAPPEQSPANAVVRMVDVDDISDSADQALWASLNNLQLPHLVVRYPAHLRIEKPVWTGPFDGVDLSRLTESPVRKELIRRLSEGQTAVWVQLDGGKQEADQAAADLLQQELLRLERELKLPALTESPEDILLGGPPLKLKFSMHRVSRDDPAEQALVAMLVGCEDDLAERTDPIVFPVFGRGRALLPLVGAGITAENVHGSAAFLVGPCSCQVKELNPGFDLLLAADWGALLALEFDPAAELASSETSLSAEPELVPIAPGATVSASKPAGPVAAEATVSTDRANSPWMVLGIVALVGAVIVVVMRSRS